MPPRPAVRTPASAWALAAVLTTLLAAVLAGCSSGEPASAPASTPTKASASALNAPLAGISLPPDPLRPLVPEPQEVPPGLVPLLAGSGTRDARAIAEFSSDPAAAATALAEHGFRSAYVAQYAHPTDGRVVSVVVVRFADAAGAQADLAGDLAGSSGDLLELPTVGQASQGRRQPLPGEQPGELVTLRFRQGSTTWLLAYGARPTADPAVAVTLAQRLVERGTA
jgi:hypothetical protein